MRADYVSGPFPLPVLTTRLVLCVAAAFNLKSRGVASNEAEEAVPSSLFCARTRTRIGDII